jgi:hypothetical protein
MSLHLGRAENQHGLGVSSTRWSGVGQTIVVRGLPLVQVARPSRRQKTIVCSTKHRIDRSGELGLGRKWHRHVTGDFGVFWRLPDRRQGLGCHTGKTARRGMEERTQFGVVERRGLGIGFRKREGTAGALQAIQFGKGILIRTLAEGDAALQAAEGFMAGHQGFAQGNALRAIGADCVVFPELGFGAEEAAEDPLIAQERIDLEALLGGEGLEASDVLVLELRELGAILAGDELRLGIEPGFEGVLGGDGLALRSAGAGGFLRCAGINRHEAGDERALQERR